MMMKLKWLIAALLFCAFSANAEVRLPDFFADNMVLQRGKEIKIWGWADKNEKVTIQFNGQSKRSKADKKGKWQIVFSAMPASADPLEMKITGKNEIILKNILIGDVWICSGQSNMNYIIEKFPYAQKEADSANFPQIRMITVEKELSVLEQEELSAGAWKEAVGKNIYKFSATAYFFGRELHKELGVPIGLIATSWGGTNVEAWMPTQTLVDYPVMDSIFQAKKADLLAQNLEEKKAERMRLINTVAKTGIGIDGQWYLPTHDIADWNVMEIPMQKGNQIFSQKDGAVWLKKEFEIPTPFRGKDLKFNLGQINDYDKVWINGNEVGESLRDSDWRNYTVKKEWLQAGKNQITVRIFDYSGAGGWVTNPYHINMHPVGDKKGYYLLSGDWKYKMGKVLEKPLELPKIPDRIFRFIQRTPSCLYNKMIYPLTNLSITGAIWYQGESNSLRGYEYSQFFPTMIEGWRKAFNQGDFPFLFVQLPNFKGKKSRGKDGALPNWAELRFAQAQALKLPNTAMAVTIDIGEANDIHPKNKQDVGKRLGMAALGMHYKKQVVYEAPTFASMKVEKEAIHLTFSEVADGLKNTNESTYEPLLNYFEIADQQGKFYPAKAKIIDATTVMVWSEEVPNPKNVRYAWENNPEQINFYNSTGLPIAPFHTGTWEWETKKNTYLKSLE